MKESACRKPIGKFDLRIESLPFADIPGQSKLFLDFLEDRSSVGAFYPSRVGAVNELASRIPDVIRNYPGHRADVCQALMEMNRSIGAGEKTFENIELLKEPGTVAVLTGQQAGLFGGPLYTVYKALSAIRLAEELSQNGNPAVPIFWAATEDHDFEEISSAYGIGHSGELFQTKIEQSQSDFEKPVGAVGVDETMIDAIQSHLESLGESANTDALRELLSDSWRRGQTFGSAFCRFISRLFAKYGLIVVDPLDQDIKRLSAPLIKEAITKTPEIVTSVLKRDRELADSGYHSQVAIEENYFPLFLISENGKRRSLKNAGDGRYRQTGENREFSLDELLEIAASEPERFSPAVLLRPVIQDHLFPTICYFGGAAEIAYFAQNSVVYEQLGRPVTPILHRQSFTIVEARHKRNLLKYELDISKMFVGFDEVSAQVIDRFLRPDVAGLFSDTDETIDRQLERLDEKLTKLDPTLSANLTTRRRKILYHINALQKKYHRALADKDAIVSRQLRGAFSELLPNGGLQERSIGITTFIDRHGLQFIDWLYESIDLNDRGHRVIYL